MKRSLLVAVAALGLALNAGAIPLTVGDANYVGAIIDGTPPGGANELNWVNELIDVAPGGSAASTNPAGETLDRTASTLAGALPDAVSGFKVEDPAQGTWIVASDSLYLLGKYGASTGTGDQISHVWYLGNLAVGTEVTLPGAGLSHDTLFSGPRNGVPDGGLTLAMLGAGLFAMGSLRRFIKR